MTVSGHGRLLSRADSAETQPPSRFKRGIVAGTRYGGIDACNARYHVYSDRFGTLSAGGMHERSVL